MSEDIEGEAELGELVDVAGADISFEGIEDIIEGDIVEADLGAIDFERDLGDFGAEGAEGGEDLRLEAGFGGDLVGDLLESGIIERAIGEFDLHLESAGEAEALDGRGNEDQRTGGLDLEGGLADGLIHGEETFFFAAFGPGFEHGVNDSAVREGGIIVDGGDATDLDGVSDAGDILDDLGDLGHHGGGAFDGGGVGHLDDRHHVALVFGGDESGGGFDEAPDGGGGEEEGDTEHEFASVDEDANESTVSIFDGLVGGVEGAGEEIFSFGVVDGAEPEGALGGFEGGGVDAAEDGGDGDDEGELAIHLASDTGEKSGGEKDGDEDEGDADDGAEEFVHGGDGGFFGRFAVFDVFGGAFDDHDGVIDHDADGEDDGEEGEGIDGEAEGGHACESADDGHGDRGGGDESGAPILEENHDHEEDEEPSFQEGFVDFVDGFADKESGIEGDFVLDAGGERLGEFGHVGADAFCGIE